MRRFGRAAVRSGLFAAAAAALCLAALAILPLAGIRVLVVTSGSMEPHIRTGDAVVVRAVDPESLRFGDVITFRGYGRGGLTTHRIVDVRTVAESTHFQTRGDANPSTDPDLAPAAGVQGRAVATLPRLGVVLAFLSGRTGRIALGVVPAGLLLAWQGIALMRPRGDR